MKDKLINRYKEDKLALDDGQGLSIESIRVMRLLVTQIEDSEVSDIVITKVKKSLKTLFKEAGSQSDHQNEDFNYFFLVTKNAYQSERLDLTAMNFEVLSLVNHISAKITPDSIGLSNKQLSLFRNYFTHKAIAAVSVEGACNSLSALKLFSEDVVLENAGTNKVMIDGGNTRLVFNMRNSFGT